MDQNISQTTRTHVGMECTGLIYPFCSCNEIKLKTTILKFRSNDGKGELLPSMELLCLPYFYIIGNVKCGTSDLWAFISKHPHINSGAFVSMIVKSF